MRLRIDRFRLGKLVQALACTLALEQERKQEPLQRCELALRKSHCPSLWCLMGKLGLQQLELRQ